MIITRFLCIVAYAPESHRRLQRSGDYSVNRSRDFCAGSIRKQNKNEYKKCTRARPRGVSVENENTGREENGISVEKKNVLIVYRVEQNFNYNCKTR